MGFEWKQNIERPEGRIDIVNLSVVFCGDDLVKKYYETKKLEMADKDKWIEENHEHINKNQDSIAKAVEDGHIPDGNIETIWKYRMNMFENGIGKAIEIKKEIETKIEQIKREVAKRLSKFLPDWKLENAMLTFTMNDSSNFCVDGSEITADIGRLIWEKDAIEKVTEGITHEVFHIWMKEKKVEKGDESNDTIKSSVIFGTVDEGLAVLVSGQSLAKHHENQGRNYDEYVTESFQFFREFLKQDKHSELEKYSSEAFKDMGHSYVVGYEIAKRVLQKIGIEKFRKLVDECRLNPEKMLSEYEAISEKLS